MKFTAGPFQLETGIAVLRLETALHHHGSRHPGDNRCFAKHGAHCQRLVEVAAGGVKIHRQMAVAQRSQEFSEAPGRIAIDPALYRDPAVATGATGVSSAPGD